MSSIFVIRFSIGGEGFQARPLKNLCGTAWHAAPGRIVTCLHCVAYGRGPRWALTDSPDGCYTLHDVNGTLVASLTPAVALPDADVAVLHATAAPPSNSWPLKLTAGLTREGGRWHADGFPKVAGKDGQRLGGKVTRVSTEVHDKQLALLVDQGTNIDWAGASGTPVVEDDDEQIIGMLTGQFDSANTCYAVGAHAIAIALWADCCVSALPGESRVAVVRALNSRAAQSGAPRPEDALCAALASGCFSAEDWYDAIERAALDRDAWKQFESAMWQRPDPPPSTAEDDLLRRARDTFRALEAPTSNPLLAVYFGSTAALAGPVFVPPKLLRLRRSAAQPLQHDAGLGSERQRVRSDAAQTEQVIPAEGPEPLNYATLVSELAGQHREGPTRLAILGEAGSGKTTLLLRLAIEILEARIGLALYLRHDELRGQPLVQFLAEDWLLRQGVAHDAVPAYAKAVRRLHSTRRLWLLVDGIDEAGSDSRAPLDNLGRELDAGLSLAHVIVACRQSYWYFGLNQLYRFTVVELERFSNEQTQAAVDLWLADLPGRGASLLAALRRPTHAYLLDSARNPLRLAMLCALWRDQVRSGQLAEQILPQTRSELYGQFVALFHDWNASRLATERTERSALFAALSAVAIAALKCDEEEIDDRTLRKALSTAGSVSVRSLRESGWLVPRHTAKPGVETYRFNHRTFLEFFAARALLDVDALLKTSGPSPCYRALDPRWREVCLFWVGHADIAPDAKDALLDRLFAFRDKCSGLYRYRALHLAAACISEHVTYTRADDVAHEVVFQAVGRLDEHGKWRQLLDPARDAALMAVRTLPAELVRKAAWVVLSEFDETPPNWWVVSALFEVITGAAGNDEDAGRVAAHILVTGGAKAKAGETLMLLDNAGFVGELRRALQRRGDRHWRAIEILGMSGAKGGPAPELLFGELRRARRAPARRELLRAIAGLGGASLEDLDFLEERAFGRRSRSREPYLHALRNLTPAPEAFAARLFEAARNATSPADRHLEIKHLAHIDVPPAAAVEDILANFETWSRHCDPLDLMRVIKHGCLGNPRLVPRYAQVLLGIRDSEFVWRSLSILREIPTCPSETERPIRGLIEACDNDGVRYWGTLLLLKIPGFDCAEAVETLAALVRRFDSKEARILETPWLAAEELRSLGQVPGNLIESLVLALEWEPDRDAQYAALTCLGTVGKESRPAAIAVLAFLQRRQRVDGFIAYVHSGRALARIGVSDSEIAAKIIRLVEDCEEPSNARWLLECMADLRIGGDEALRVARYLARKYSQDDLLLEDALGYLATRADRRIEVVALATELSSSAEPSTRMRALYCLAQVGRDDAEILALIARRLATETDGQAFHAATRAFRSVFDNPVIALRAVPALRRALDKDLPVERDRDLRRAAVLGLLQDIAARVPYEVFLCAWQEREVRA